MKNKTLATILALCLGFLGMHQFYLNDNITGILYLIFCWTLLPIVLSVMDFFILLWMKHENFNKLYNKKLFL